MAEGAAVVGVWTTIGTPLTELRVELLTAVVLGRRLDVCGWPGFKKKGNSLVYIKLNATSYS